MEGIKEDVEIFQKAMNDLLDPVKAFFMKGYEAGYDAGQRDAIDNIAEKLSSKGIPVPND